MKNKYRPSGLRKKTDDDDFNPMDGVANMADVMLVLACGLMTALIVNWNVDIGLRSVDIDKGREVSETEAAETLDEDQYMLDADKGYEKMGILYKDPETGKLYMLTEAEG